MRVSARDIGLSSLSNLRHPPLCLLWWMDIEVKASGGAAGAVAFYVSSTTPAESVNRVVEAAERVTLCGLTSAVNDPAAVSAESSGGAAGAFAAVHIYDPSSQNCFGSQGTNL